MWDGESHLELTAREHLRLETQVGKGRGTAAAAAAATAATAPAVLLDEARDQALNGLCIG